MDYISKKVLNTPGFGGLPLTDNKSFAQFFAGSMHNKIEERRVEIYCHDQVSIFTYHCLKYLLQSYNCFLYFYSY